MKTILISGGSDGLGKALANSLQSEYQVVILSRDPVETENAAEEIGCDFEVADVTDPAQLQNAVSNVIKKFGKIDFLVNNAGIWIEGALETNNPQEIKRAMEVNATGTILLTHSVLPHMKEAQVGRIINVISQAGLNAKPERSVYNASKWAITGFTKSLIEELVGTGVTVTGFYPGSMKTNFFAKAHVQKDTSRYLELSEVVRTLKFIIETPDNILIPELGIRPYDIKK